MKCTAFAIIFTSALIELVTPFDGQFNEYNNRNWDSPSQKNPNYRWELNIKRGGWCMLTTYLILASDVFLISEIILTIYPCSMKKLTNYV